MSKWAIEIPPLTDEVVEAMKAHAAAWEAWKARTHETYYQAQTDWVDACRRVNEATYAAIGPWQVFDRNGG